MLASFSSSYCKLQIRYGKDKWLRLNLKKLKNNSIYFGIFDVKRVAKRVVKRLFETWSRFLQLLIKYMIINKVIHYSPLSVVIIISSNQMPRGERPRTLAVVVY
jgi:hypothetical protein